jgi:putative photosynthetic complex assembly protein 2
MTLVATIAHAALFTVFVWWFTTGAILYLDGLPRRTFKVSMAVATVLLVLALYGAWALQDDTTVTGAFVAFSCALIAWGWNEMAFLMGFLTGPRRIACPPGVDGLTRLSYAVQVVLWHEIAIAVTGLAILALTVDGANKVAFQTFALLWVLRLSAKANVFLGVRNFSEEFLPVHLRYIESYFRRASMNAVFPLSITGTTLLVGILAHRMLAADATPFEVTAATLLCVLAALALLEHWLLVLPISATALWRWGLASREHGLGATEAAPLLAPSPLGPATIVPAGALPTTPSKIVPFPTLETTLPRRRP